MEGQIAQERQGERGWGRRDRESQRDKRSRVGEGQIERARGTESNNCCFLLTAYGILRTNPVAVMFM